VARGSSATSGLDHSAAALSSAGGGVVGAWTVQPHPGAESSPFAGSPVATPGWEVFPAGVQQQGPGFSIALQNSDAAPSARTEATATGVPGTDRESPQAAA